MEYYVLLAVLFAAAFFDAKENRIPNELSLASLISALLLRGWQDGMDDMLLSVLRAAILFVILFPLWIFRILGAGDIKIMMASGVFLGKDMVPFLFCAGGCTAVLSLFLMISRRNLFKRMKVFLLYMKECITARRLLSYPFDRSKEKDDGGILVSYGLLAGHLLALCGGFYHM